MAKNKNQKLILEILGTRPIAFNASLAHAMGSAKAGLFLSQLLFWWEKGRDPDWIYKTIKEVQEETSLSRREQETAIKICEDNDLIVVKLRGIPAKRHFHIKMENIANFLQKYADEKHIEKNGTSLPESDKQDWLKDVPKIGLW
jgi:hypothetical protein